MNTENFGPRWQVFTTKKWMEGILHGSYELKSEADKAAQELRDKGFNPWLYEVWPAHYTHSSSS